MGGNRDKHNNKLIIENIRKYHVRKKQKQNKVRKISFGAGLLNSTVRLGLPEQVTSEQRLELALVYAMPLHIETSVWSVLPLPLHKPRNQLRFDLLSEIFSSVPRLSRLSFCKIFSVHFPPTYCKSEFMGLDTSFRQ